MSSLTEIKNTYAQEQGYPDWQFLRDDNFVYAEEMEDHMDEICIRAQKAALEKAAENAILKHIGANYREPWCVDRTSISNPENLIR